MRTFKTLVLVGAIVAATGTQAASTGDMNISLDWGSLSISGLLTPSSITDPVTGQTFSSDADGWVGGESGDLDNDSSINGASATASYMDTYLDLAGGYDSTNSLGYGDVSVMNTGTGVQSGYAGGWRGFVYQATGTGSVSVSVDYSLTGSVATDTLQDYANGGYEVLIEAIDADLWVSTYNSEFASNGGDAAAAEDAADIAALLNEYIFNDWALLECFGATPCVDSTAPGAGGTLSLFFDVVSGTNYSFGAEGLVGVYTDVSAVPVPAAAWLFGSGLLGLIGVARRKKA